MQVNSRGEKSRGKRHYGISQRKRKPILVLFHNWWRLNRPTKGCHRMRISVQLECGCERFYQSPIPHYGDAVCCPIHGSTTRVTVPEWFLRCNDCRYSKGFGNSPLTVEVKASVHSTKRNHTVKVWRRIGSRVDSEYLVPTERRAQLPIVAGDVPPF